MFTKLFPKKPSEPEQISSSVRVIGDRASGKTTYMAALVRQPNADPTLSVVDSVKPLNNEGEELIRKAVNLLEKGDTLEPTPVGAGVDSVKDYSIEIKVRKESAGCVTLNVNCKDYPGEFFSDILYRQNDPFLDDYIQDCIYSNGLMVLLDGMSFRRDQEYAIGLERLLMLMDQNEINMSERRIAVVLTKCEQSELWINRHNPRLIARRFPQIMQKLQVWKNSGLGMVDYFASSAFGMFGNRYPRPNMNIVEQNRFGIKACILKEPKNWLPFGLVAPIYWLCTGKRHSKLDQE
jgi:GTPase SAR1 family protein